MTQINITIVSISVFTLVGYVALMYIPYFKNNKRRGGFLTLTLATMTIMLAVILYVLKGMNL
jgi:hypothetical protein